MVKNVLNSSLFNIYSSKLVKKITHTALFSYFKLCFLYSYRFSEVFDTVSRNSHDDVFYEDDIWPGEDQNG